MTLKDVGGWRAVVVGTLLALLALAGGWLLFQRDPPRDARPALWRLEKDDRQAWLFGTIHAVPKDALWMTPTIQNAIRQSDWLWLEVTGLGDEHSNLSTFERLGRSANLPTLSARLDPDDRSRLAALAARNGAISHDLDHYKSWAAALLINARGSADSGFSSRGGGEAVLASAFGSAGKPSAGLETISGQLGFFDRLPEVAQRALLAQSIRDSGTSGKLLAQLYRHWSVGDTDALSRVFDDGLGQEQSLRSILVDQRNARWAAQIDAIMARHRSTPFIAVGAGHLTGPNNLLRLLEARGWRTARVQ